MNPRKVPIYVLLPERHPGLGDTDLLDLVASRFPIDVWRTRIAEQGALAVAFEHARWLTTQDKAPLSVPVMAMTTRAFSFQHGVLSFTLDDLLTWFVDHGCVDASDVETLPTDPPPTPPDWTPNVEFRPPPEPEGLRKHWLFDAHDPYAVLEAMGDTPERPVLTIGHDSTEEPHLYIVVPVRYALDSAAGLERLLTRLRAEAEAAAAKDDANENGGDGHASAYGDATMPDFERFWECAPPFPREAHADWLPAWLHQHLERRVPQLAADQWEVDPATEDETLETMAAALREVGFIVTDEDLVPRVATWIDRYYELGLE